MGALKVPVEVIDNTDFFQSRAAETFKEKIELCRCSLESYSLELYDQK